MKIGMLFSGGKDSCLALHKAMLEGHEVLYLLTIIPENKDSFMFHCPYVALLKKQAEMLGIKLIILKSKGEKEKELLDLKKLIEKVKGKVDSVCVGGIASNYQGSRIKKICGELGVGFYAPLWSYNSEKIWAELLNDKFKVIITKIACEGIGEKFIGKVIDGDVFIELKKKSEKYKFRLDFEGGEAETAVLFMPEFSNEIRIDYKIIKEGQYNFILDVKKVK